MPVPRERAELVTREQVRFDERCFAVQVIWRVPRPLPGSAHVYKYRLAYVVDGVCVLRYDNEAGKGDHRHLDDQEQPYAFSTIDQLSADFLADARGRWLARDRHLSSGDAGTVQR